ncbi:MAG: hypothetical protein IJX72_01575 [Clostridia bacterium]|nr:hypothetical protein [Clostridia bacterium]
MKQYDLLEALSEADERLVDRAAGSMSRKPKSFGVARLFRIGAVAVSVALVLAVGAVALPLMLANDPVIPPNTGTVQGSVQTDPDDFGNTSVSIMYLVSQDIHGGEDSIVNSETQDSFWSNNFALMTFDCPEGETVSVTAFWESLFVRAYPNDGNERWEGLDPTNAEDRKTYLGILSETRFSGISFGKRDVTLDVTSEYLIWKYDTDALTEPMRNELSYYLKKLESVKEKYGEQSAQYQKTLMQYQERYDSMVGDDYDGLQLAANEDVLSYMTRNADGEITGVGAVYVCRKHLIENTDHTYYVNTYISRYADLSYVRFDTPVTEEEAEEQLKELYKAIPEAKENLDFTPVGKHEHYKAGLADLLNTVVFEAPENHMVTSGFGGNSGDDYCTFHIGFVPKDSDVIDATHADRAFRIYSDGTWEEITLEEITE